MTNEQLHFLGGGFRFGIVSIPALKERSLPSASPASFIASMRPLLPKRSVPPHRSRSDQLRVIASGNFNLPALILFCLTLAAPAAVAKARWQQHAPAPAFRPNSGQAPRPAQRPLNGNNAGPGQGAKNQEHLSEWLNRHRDLPLAMQQRALENEPGFKELPAQTQQRMRDRLTQLNNMRPEQRDRILERNEAMERLSPQQRQQFVASVRQLGAMPLDRRRAVARAVRDLRSMPEDQRQQYLNSPAYHSQFSDEERGTIGNLMTFEAYLPAPRPSAPAPPQ
jgi:hypothetical protein